MAKRRTSSHAIHVKRIQEPAAADDGTRVLVDRLWPRGVSKAKANIDVWLKEIAPSNELRKWFDHDPAKWEKFQQRYHRELDGRKEELQQLRDLIKAGPVTLLFAAKDTEHNNAVALKNYL